MKKIVDYHIIEENSWDDLKYAVKSCMQYAGMGIAYNEVRWQPLGAPMRLKTRRYLLCKYCYVQAMVKYSDE